MWRAIELDLTRVLILSLKADTFIQSTTPTTSAPGHHRQFATQFASVSTTPIVVQPKTQCSTTAVSGVTSWGIHGVRVLCVREEDGIWLTKTLLANEVGGFVMKRKVLWYLKLIVFSLSVLYFSALYALVIQHLFSHKFIGRYHAIIPCCRCLFFCRSLTTRLVDCWWYSISVGSTSSGHNCRRPPKEVNMVTSSSRNSAYAEYRCAAGFTTTGNSRNSVGRKECRNGRWEWVDRITCVFGGFAGSLWYIG